MPLHTYAFYTLFAPAAAIAAVIGPLFQDFVSASTASIDENMRKVVREMTFSSPTKRKSDETPMLRPSPKTHNFAMFSLHSGMRL